MSDGVVVTRGRVLIIAGSDSGGCAGIQADLKAVLALGGFGTTAITALTAQNTQGVQAVHPVPASFIRQQLQSVLTDIGADCFKTGMLHDVEVIETVAGCLDEWGAGVPLVVDPVMVSQTGASLLQRTALDALRGTLLPRATLITPNLPEAELLLERSIDGAEAMPAAASQMAERYGCAVLLKGGHLPDGEELVDVLVSRGQVEVFRHPRIHTDETHGTGCTLASAIAVGLAQGMSLTQAVGRARRYLLDALRSAPGFGCGGGPVNHAHTVSVERLRLLAQNAAGE